MDRAFISCCLFIFICSIFKNVSSASVETSKSNRPPTTNSSRRGGLVHDPLIFPSERPTPASGTQNLGGLLDRSDLGSPSPCPEGALFCESADDYPKDFIKSKLKEQPKLLLDILYEEELGEEIHNKITPDSEKELCTSRPKIIYPNKAQSKEGVFEFVVNDDVHKQGVRVEICTNSGGECNLPGCILSLGYKSKCVQKTIIRALVVLNREDGSDVQGFVTKPFEFPSCCSCSISLDSAHSRFGGRDDTTPANVTAQTTPTAKPKCAN